MNSIQHESILLLVIADERTFHYLNIVNWFYYLGKVVLTFLTQKCFEFKRTVHVHQKLIIMNKIILDFLKHDTPISRSVIS